MKYNIGNNLLINAASKANVGKLLYELTEDTENGTAGEYVRGWNAALRAVKEKMELQEERERDDSKMAETIIDTDCGMTREEVIKYGIEWLKDEYLDAKDEAFIKIALKALEQEPCEDAISREDALMCLTGEIKETDTIETIIARSGRRIKSLPSVNPQEPKTGHWIETAEEYYKAVNEYCGGVNENTPYFVDDIAWSECLAKYSVIDNETERFDHCPSCGAKMEEVE